MKNLNPYLKIVFAFVIGFIANALVSYLADLIFDFSLEWLSSSGFGGGIFAALYYSQNKKSCSQNTRTPNDYLCLISI